MATRLESTAERLKAITDNLWWCWQSDAVNLFREIDLARYRELNRNPKALLAELSAERLQELIDDVGLLGRVNYQYRRLHEYLASDRTWSSKSAGALLAHPVAYFSAEFCVHESLPIYSGGLGVLAGDHLKSASDLGIPLVGVGLFYRQGYFYQHLDADGWQRESYLTTDLSNLAMHLARDARGEPLVVSVETRVGSIAAKVWELAIGRARLFLLDSDVEPNNDADRRLTARLYGGGSEVRIRQELLLGVGGMRALAALGIRPGVLHLNEGHSAFAALEAAAQRMVEEQITFELAANRVARQVVFTTHTPVAAGHDRFSPALVGDHLGPLSDALGLSANELLALGRVNPDDATEEFCMTVLALKLAHSANGVSSLHGQISRNMWKPLWPGRDEQEVPIGHITNGVHVRSWLAPLMRRLYDRHFAPDWLEHIWEPELWDAIDDVDDAELWETHKALKVSMINFVRRNTAEQAVRRGEQPDIVRMCERSLRAEALTIGFARRFATYKRGTLILSDLDRLDQLVNDPDRPVQIVFAGKAHPNDDGGKRLLQTIFRVTRDPRFAGKVALLENYDMNIGRHLVQGVDVWLNNPRRPLEASGTSGQKVVLNGGLNCSILDGWWAEAYDGLNGFAIGTARSHSDTSVQDDRDREALYQTLGTEAVPLFFERDKDDLPRAWIRRMKRAIRTLGWRFNADRMVVDYAQECYLPAAGATSCRSVRGAPPPLNNSSS